MPNTARTGRMTNALLAVSTTPRTTRRYMEELENLCQRANRNEVIYLEVKECMDNGDVATALTLIDLLPDNFRNVADYKRQCAVYDALCKNGVVERAGLVQMRRCLSEILYEKSDSQSIIRYADALVLNGYNERSIMTTTMYSMEEAMNVAQMTEGHRQLFATFAEWNTPFTARTWVKLLMSIEKCAPVMACLGSAQKRMSSKTPTSSSKKAAEANDDIHTGPTGRVKEGVETGVHKKEELDTEDARVEATLVRWKTTETMVGMTGNAFAGDDDDDESTRGDEEEDEEE